MRPKERTSPPATPPKRYCQTHFSDPGTLTRFSKGTQKDLSLFLSADRVKEGPFGRGLSGTSVPGPSSDGQWGNGDRYPPRRDGDKEFPAPRSLPDTIGRRDGKQTEAAKNPLKEPEDVRPTTTTVPPVRPLL